MPKRRAKSKRRGADPLPTKLQWWVWLTAVVIVVAAVAILRRATQEQRNLATTADTEPTIQPRPAADTASESEPLAFVTTKDSQNRRAAEQHVLDPRADGWSTEVLAERAKEMLNELVGAAVRDAEVDVEKLRTIVSPEFRGTELRPAELVETYRDASIIVQRQRSSEPVPDQACQGVSGLAEALSQLAAPLRDRSERNTHVKIIRVSLESDVVTTRAIVETSGRSASGSVAQHANWDCRWQRLSDDLLQLQSIVVGDYQEVTATGPGGVWFADCTESVLGSNASFRDQLLYGLNHWLGRIERVHGMHVFARWGLAVGDVNGDDLDDVYVCQPGGLPNRLYVQNPDGTATDRSAASGVNWLDHTSSALLVDLDNDRDQELVLATPTGLLVMENDASGRFQLQATLAPTDTDFMSLSACDYDHDGDLDLYACVEFTNRSDRSRAEPNPFVYHDANDGGANVLFRNDISIGDGQWQFTDVTQDVGLDVNNRRHSLAAAWEDFDNDGDQDLYVANDYGQNCLYLNEDGRFVDVAAEREVVDFGSGMSVSWGDFNRDGWMDLYVANMFSSAGNRITRQGRFKPAEDAATRAIYSRFAKGNSLFANIESQFQEVSAEAAVEMGRWAWSSLFADLNNDGWEDILVANGYITTEDTGDL